MNKLTISILALLALTLTGCEVESDSDFAERITEFNYKGHRYLRYSEWYGKGRVGGITHDPDCPCLESSAQPLCPAKKGGEE